MQILFAGIEPDSFFFALFKKRSSCDAIQLIDVPIFDFEKYKPQVYDILNDLQKVI